VARSRLVLSARCPLASLHPSWTRCLRAPRVPRLCGANRRRPPVLALLLPYSRGAADRLSAGARAAAAEQGGMNSRGRLAVTAPARPRAGASRGSRWPACPSRRRCGDARDCHVSAVARCGGSRTAQGGRLTPVSQSLVCATGSGRRSVGPLASPWAWAARSRRRPEARTTDDLHLVVRAPTPSPSAAAEGVCEVAVARGNLSGCWTRQSWLCRTSRPRGPQRCCQATGQRRPRAHPFRRHGPRPPPGRRISR
jgi:hypothetical protein